MFKRANKITALVVAAASIMSVVPAMAAERLTTKDGTVKQGIAFEDGKYGYYGYRTDDDETGVWYNKGGEDKDSAIEDLDEYEYKNTAKYGEKYAYAINDGNNDDEYLIDLSTGKVVEDETVEEKEDAARSKLKSALKKAERYNELLADGDEFAISETEFKRVLTGQFGEVWYRYTSEAAIKYRNDANPTTTSCAAVVLTNDAGKYIDISVDANMRVYSTKKERAIMIDKYDKDYDDAGLNVRLNKIQVLAQTKDDFYVLTEVEVTDLYKSNAKSTQYFIQKISKARDGQTDGAYVPKTVTSYQLDEKAIYDNGDAKDAYTVIMKTDDGYDPEDNLYAANGDNLYVTRVKSDKAKVFTLKLGKVKVDGMDRKYDNAKLSNPVGIAAGIDDIDTNLVKKTDDDDHDLTDDAIFNSTTEKYDETSAVDPEDQSADNEITAGSIKTLNTAVSVDTEGNTWVLDQGKIYKYTGGEFKEMYKVDRNADSLDVYNEGNLIAYEKAGDAYTTVQEGKKETVAAGDVIEPRVTTPATVGWKQEATGWTFYDVNGAKVSSKWVIDNGTWYYIKADGIMATGWFQDPANGTWYYLRGNGAMATGWVQDGNAWYYLSGSGAMLANTTVDGYVLGANGAWIQ